MTVASMVPPSGSDAEGSLTAAPVTKISTF
jgi:hypothetical protein